MIGRIALLHIYAFLMISMKETSTSFNFILHYFRGSCARRLKNYTGQKQFEIGVERNIIFVMVLHIGTLEEDLMA